jgi:hypothetical protein
MANGKKGDHPQISADRYHHWKIPRFSPRADELISEIRDFPTRHHGTGHSSSSQTPAVATANLSY